MAPPQGIDISHSVAAGDGTARRFIDRLYEHCEEDDGWKDALEELADALQASFMAIHVYDWDLGRGETPDVLRGPSLSELRPDYLEHSSNNIWMQAFRTAPLPEPGQVIASHRLFPEEELVRHSFYRGFLKRYDLFASAGAVLEVAQRRIKTVTLLRGRKSGRYSVDEERFLARVAPHLRNVHRVEQRFAAARSARAILSEVLDRLPTAVVALDTDLRVVLANEAAQGVLTLGDGLRRSRRGRLEVGDAVAARKLRKAVIGLARTLRGEESAAGGAFPIARPSYRRPYAATVIPVRPLVPRGAAAGACCLLLIEDLDQQIGPPERRLIELWGLTETEARVAALLAAGNAPRDIADALEVSFNTVRTHLQHIFLKTDTRRQGELVRLLTRLAVTVAQE